MRSRARRSRSGERGATAVVVSVVIVVLAGFLALVMNVGRLMMVRGQLHTGTDAGALAGARDLNGTVEGVSAARASAVAWANRHVSDRDVNLAVGDADVEVGYWDRLAPRESAFTPITSTDPAALDNINAVLVRAGREASRGNAAETIMAGVLGGAQGDTKDVTAESVAVYGGACDSACAVPLVFSSCIIKDTTTHELNCDQQLVFSSDTEDNIGFTNLADDPSVSTTAVRDLLANGTACSKDVDVGDPVGVANGNNLAPVYQQFAALAGQTVVVPVVDLGPCPAKFTSHSPTAPIVGFASFTIDRVEGPPSNTIYLTGKCEWVAEKSFIPGCQFFGVTPVSPRLVR